MIRSLQSEPLACAAFAEGRKRKPMRFHLVSALRGSRCAQAATLQHPGPLRKTRVESFAQLLLRDKTRNLPKCRV
jgi:hypothetical protein